MAAKAVQMSRTFVQVLVVRRARQGQEVLLGKWKPGAPLVLEGRYTGLLGEVTEADLQSSPDGALQEWACRHARSLAGLSLHGSLLEKRAVFVFDGEFEEHEYVYSLDHGQADAHDMVAGLGEPRESPLMMKPSWFPVEDIPYSQMPADDLVWYPPVLQGHLMTGYFNFEDPDGREITQAHVVKVGSVGREVSEAEGEVFFTLNHPSRC